MTFRIASNTFCDDHRWLNLAAMVPQLLTVTDSIAATGDRRPSLGARPQEPALLAPDHALRPLFLRPAQGDLLSADFVV